MTAALEALHRWSSLMRNIHSFSIYIYGFILSTVVLTAAAATAPPAPTITNTITDGQYSIVYGVAQKNSSYNPAQIYICVADKDPAASPDDCTVAAAIHGPASLLNPAIAGGNYVVPAADDTFTAVLSPKLKPGQYVYLVVLSNPVAGGATLNVVSAVLQVPNAFMKTAPLGAAVAGLDISGAS